MVILDLKGDAALFQTVKAEAEARGQTFLFFTPEKNRDTHRFNPFHDFDSESRSDAQLCQLFLDALSLNHGEGYGTGYFSLRSRSLLYRALQDTNSEGKQPRSFPELWEVLERFGEEMSSSDEYRDAFELVGTIQALARCEAMIDDPNIPAIHMPTVIEQRQVVYFWLPAAIESVTAREIGKLAVYSLLSAAIDRQRKQSQLPPDQRTTRQVYLVIDEFQRLAGDNFRIILEQARSFGIAAILSNQSISDLQTRDTDLRPTVRTNTRVKMFFSVTDPAEAETLSALSGEEVIEERTRTVSYNLAESRFLPHSQSESLRDARKPRLSVSDIQAYSDHPNDFIMHVSRGSGYTQFGGLPVPVRTAWPLPFPLYQQRSVAAWPTIEKGQGVTNEKGPKDIEQDQRIETERHEQETLKRIYKRRSPGNATE